jgi:transcriptional regulator with XRE-family HTH domain
MRDLELGRLLRALRRRMGWRQRDCAARASVHRSTWSRLERGHLDRASLATIRDCLAVLEVRLELVPRWRGGDVERVRDRFHAALQTAWKQRLEHWGWQVWVEVSFNHYGDRGRVDLVAWHPVERLLLIIEIKTEIDDVQALLGSLDIKRRVAYVVARELAIPSFALAVPFLIVADGTTNRDRVARYAPLFSRFSLRGRTAIAWLKRPGGSPTGLLAYTDLRYATGMSVKATGSHRVRRRRSVASVEERARQPNPAGE